MSDGCDTREEILEEIALLKQARRDILTAIRALATGAQSYQLDTGQTRQLVTKAQLGSLQLTYSRLGSEISTLQQRLGCARIYVRPAW